MSPLPSAADLALQMAFRGIPEELRALVALVLLQRELGRLSKAPEGLLP